MSSKKSSSEKRSAESAVTKLNSKFRLEDDDFDPNLFSDIKGLASALHMIKQRARKDGQRKKEETIPRQNFSKALSEFKREAFLINETVKFQEIYEKFCKEKAAHLQAIKGYIH